MKLAVLGKSLALVTLLAFGPGRATAARATPRKKMTFLPEEERTSTRCYCKS